MNTEIFFLMYFLILWTSVIFLFSTAIRIKEIYFNYYFNKPVINQGQHRHPPFTKGSLILKNIQRNLINLFEFPIFFYTVCVMIFLTNKIDPQFIYLAYCFIFFRIAYSIYHIFFNHLILNGGFPVRSFLWIPSTLILIWMRRKLFCLF